MGDNDAVPIGLWIRVGMVEASVDFLAFRLRQPVVLVSSLDDEPLTKQPNAS